MDGRFDKHILKNGMVIRGAANIIADWIFRGAGDKNSRQLSNALDALGLHRAVSAGSSHINVGAVLEAGNLEDALKLYGEVILQAALKKEEFELSRQLAVDSVLAMDDDPRQKVMLQVRGQFYRQPWGRSTIGEIEQLRHLTAEATAEILENNFNLSGTIFSVAGKYDFAVVCRQIEAAFNAAAQKSLQAVTAGTKGQRYKHLNNQGAQVHIGLMTETVNPQDADYYQAVTAVSVLSGGMSARLFTEVREKRGLCYAIGARYHGLKDFAGIMCYAGTTPDKAQETVDVIKEQFYSLAGGISGEELQRARVGLKSSLILHSESSSSRACAIGSDYYVYGRVRSLDEIKEKVEETTVDSVLDFLARRKFGDFTAVTIGPKQVTV